VTPEAIEAHCLSLPAATKVVQWGGSRVFKVGGKIFAACGEVWPVAFKASEIAYELLPEQGLARPARYLYRAKWLELDRDALGEEVLRGYLSEAHGLVVARLSRRLRAELGLA
jgi:predicted DNA-binding protein (MmcQ/YjbR family)